IRGRNHLGGGIDLHVVSQDGLGVTGGGILRIGRELLHVVGACGIGLHQHVPHVVDNASEAFLLGGDGCRRGGSRSVAGVLAPHDAEPQQQGDGHGGAAGGGGER